MPNGQLYVMPKARRSSRWGVKPVVQLLPRLDLVIDRRGSRFDGSHVTAENFVNNALLVPEVLIELALLPAGGADDLVGIRGAESLPVKELGGGADHVSLRFDGR
jgi:hypothetical protein